MNWLLRLLKLKPQTQPAPKSSMRKTPDGIYEIRLVGVFSRNMLTQVQNIAVTLIDKGQKDLKILVLLNDFAGWRGGDDWDNIDFLMEYGQYISKIAAVGSAEIKENTLLFLLAGRRPGEVRFFTLDQVSQARAWLLG